MSPTAPIPLGSGSSSTIERESTAARVLGAGTAGIAELAIFHPVDTIAKRLMSNQGKIASSTRLNEVIFRKHASEPFVRRFFTLFPGLGYAAAYKILQRIYKYGGQPFIVLLPLDVLKIKRQTNPEAFRGRGVLRIVRDEGFALYRGWGWTAARNAPGSFALFGGSAAAKQYLYKLSDYNSATWFQNFVASIAGSSASLIVSAPLDVVKTRIQNQNFEVKESGMRVIANMARNEGASAFFKGLVPKLLMTGPKLTFSFWLAQTLIPAFNKMM
ncbi:high copy suppressor of abf2 [Friedmanniomyces endolithicus]|uniref:High copy suppressor of abf2 n=1 Tax=Rachicladosporium monterosium TaxID=1507873 RepID=A0ABR0L4I2_9PEZI|nr:high copy suppressor of abf2 [Friedmanniomyces endolithicus]KAK5143361.1 high copy suppressor of abf2 [Rachicladosporium monterosium]